MKLQRILIIAPFPPPHTGNSLPVKMLYDHLKIYHEVKIVNLNKAKHKAGISSVDRIFQILRVLYAVFINRNKYDKIYLTVAESIAGNLRDLFVYYILRKRLDALYIHMFGGANMDHLLSDKYPLIFSCNKRYLKRLAGVFVEGYKQKETFARVIDRSKIHVVFNFAENHLFINESSLREKFSKLDPLRILFLSNMLYGKGHFELIEAINLLPDEFKKMIRVDFAGKLVDSKKVFLEKLEACKGFAIYHGSVSGRSKQDLFQNAHVFCMPTYYPYEGQPFSIIESMANGCFLITTNHSGIVDIFKDNINGYVVQKKSVSDLVTVLKRVIQNKSELFPTASYNFENAKKVYTVNTYCSKMSEIILEKL
jgi:glycosyltransferase involved in cell wall biosynthesis